jgi:glycosyltransferase involved in cell wall biosynthesis
MKIGIVTTWFERGAAYVSRQYADVLRNAGHEVFVFARGGESYAQGDPNWDFDWVHWGRIRLWQNDLKVDKRDFVRWLRHNHVEVVIFNEQRDWLAVFLCQDLGIKTIAYVDYYKEDEVADFANYDGLICNTKRHYSVFDWHPGALYIPWGTDTKLFAPKRESFELIAPDRVTFFHSAGMSPHRKGTDILLNSFEKLTGPAKLIVHSQESLESKLPEQATLIRRLIETDRIRVVEETVPAPGLYHLGDIYVYPTRLEGIGLTLCEALSCGLPLIIPDNAPMNEFVPDEQNVGRKVAIDKYVARSDGYYWPQSIVDAGDLSLQMQWYVDHSDQIPALKRNAREYAKLSRDWEKNTGTLSGYVEGIELVSGQLRTNARQRVKIRGAAEPAIRLLNGRVLSRLRPLWRFVKRWLLE